MSYKLPEIKDKRKAAGLINEGKALRKHLIDILIQNYSQVGGIERTKEEVGLYKETLILPEKVEDEPNLLYEILSTIN